MDEWDLLGKNSLGYPVNLNYDYTSCFDSLQYNINNVGDPFSGSNYSYNTLDIEKTVLSFFANLWNVKTDYWGYITFSGTEGNMEGLLVGRERFPNGILYTSDQSHYSLFKIAKMFRMETKIIPTTPNGEIDYDKFKDILDNTKPAIINANIGTTMKGAVDDVSKIVDIVKKKDIDYHLHKETNL